jgi:hypothetical protein
MTIDPAFAALIDAFCRQNYAFRFFDDLAERNSLYLRHDVDFSLALAAEMSDAERDLGVASTYFVLLSSNFYNPASAENRAYARRITDNGCRLALHFNPEIHADVDAGFEQERAQFENLYETKLGIVSIHRPRGFLDDNNRPLGGVPHTYQDVYFKDMKYVADSGGSFRFGHPAETAEFAAGKNIHLNLHPIWWFGDFADSPTRRLRNWRASNRKFLESDIAANCTTYEAERLDD